MAQVARLGRAAGRRQPAAGQRAGGCSESTRAIAPIACWRPPPSATSRSIPTRSRSCASTSRWSSASTSCPASSRRRSPTPCRWCCRTPTRRRSTSRGAPTTRRAGPRGDVRIASPRYFETLGIPVLAGRAFTDLDHRESQRVVVVNQAMVRHWDGGDPVGSRALGRQRRDVVDGGRRRRRRPSVRPRSRRRAAGLHPAGPDADRPRRPDHGAQRRPTRPTLARGGAPTPSTPSIPTCRSRTCRRSRRCAASRWRRRG